MKMFVILWLSCLKWLSVWQVVVRHEIDRVLNKHERVAAKRLQAIHVIDLGCHHIKQLNEYE